MSVRLVSTFNADHAPIYGERFLAGCELFGVPLTLVCYEDFSGVPSHGEARLDARRGEKNDDVDLWRWRECAASLPPTTNYRFQAARFAWKVFAQTRADVRWGVQWLVWLDADVELTCAPDWSILDPAVDVCYLGRSEWDHSECGFLAWNLATRGGEGLDEFRRFYVEGDIFGAEQLHDSWVFDRVRERLDLIALNLSPDARGLDAWAASPLSAWSHHHKGPGKFNGSFAASA